MWLRWSFLAAASLSLVLFGASEGTSRCLANEFPLWPFDETPASDDVDREEGQGWRPGSRLAGLFRPQTDERGEGVYSDTLSGEDGYILGQNHPSAWQLVANTPRRMAGRVRSLWSRSLDLLSFDDDGSRPTARRTRQRRPLFGRLFGEEEATGPLTINEWMEQERPR